MLTLRKEDISFCPYIQSAYSIQHTCHLMTSCLLMIKYTQDPSFEKADLRNFLPSPCLEPCNKTLFLYKTGVSVCLSVHHWAVDPCTVTFLCETLNFQWCRSNILRDSWKIWPPDLLAIEQSGNFLFPHVMLDTQHKF